MALSAGERAAAAKADGNTAYRDGDYDRAAQCYSRAIEADPSDHLLYSNRAAANLSAGKSEEALNDITECLSLNSDFAKGHARKGKILLAMGKKPQAAVAYTRALELSPGNAEWKKQRDEALGKSGSNNNNNNGVEGNGGGGGGAMNVGQATAFLRRNARDSVKFLIRGFILSQVLLYLLPIGAGAAQGAYARAMFFAALHSGYTIYETCGTPRIDQAYFQSILRCPATQSLILAIFFWGSRPFFLGLVPVLLWDLVQFAFFLARLLLPGAGNGSLSPWLARTLSGPVDTLVVTVFQCPEFKERSLPG